MLLQRLANQTEAQESRLHSLSPHGDTVSLDFVLAVLRHNLTPSTTTNLVNGLRDMRSEIQLCLRKLDTAFQHTWRLYSAMSNGLARTPSTGSTFSTTTALTARINLVDWLKGRQGTCGISVQRNGTITVSTVVVIWPQGSWSVNCFQLALFHPLSDLSHSSPYTRVRAVSRVSWMHLANRFKAHAHVLLSILHSVY